MKKNIIFLAFVIFSLLPYSCNNEPKKDETKATEPFKPNPQYVKEQDVKTLEIGAPAPDFTLPDMNGTLVSLKDFAKAKVLVIAFICNHCPTAQAYEDRLIKFTGDYKDKDVQVVAIMPNSGMGLLLEECGYSDLDDAFDNMKIRAKDKNFNFPYLYDGDNHVVTIKYGPVSTPHVFVFDQERKLKYVGNIDQNEKPGTGNAENLRSATDAVLAGKPVTNPVTKAFGCSIKWAWKLDWVKKVNKDWDAKPVEISDIDIAGIKKLLKNDSKKLRLINVWATWCAPCVAEYPDLVNLQRMYGARDFEFISISADKPEKKESALEFLKKSHSALQNYIFSVGDSYKLIEAVDPSWDGALPYSILIEPQGKVIWKYQGVVDLLDLKKKIVDNPLIGRYF
jgi:peroxiredoxin